jgi:2-oxoglutarate ferredoxin oxidoreductase subunit gamma
MAEEIGKKIVMNVITVGFFAAKSGLLTREAYRAAIADSVPAAARELNLRAFESGYDYGLRDGKLEESLEEIAEAVEE